MKANDVRAKTADELKQELLDLKKEQFNLRFQGATQQLETPREFGKYAATSHGLKQSCAKKA